MNRTFNFVGCQTFGISNIMRDRILNKLNDANVKKQLLVSRSTNISLDNQTFRIIADTGIVSIILQMFELKVKFNNKIILKTIVSIH